MLDLLIAAVVTAPVYPPRRETRAPLVVVAQDLSAATEYVGLALPFHELLGSSAATFRFGSDLQRSSHAEARTSTVTVTATYVMGGTVKRPPLDDQLVYFDE